MSKRILIIFSLLFSLLSTFNPLYADPPLPTPVGRVVWVKGILKAIMLNKEERTLQKTSLIYLHDTLITDSTTQAGVVFTDNTLMTFKEGTTFKIDEYSFNPKAKTGQSAGKFVMNLIAGGFRTITGIIAKKADDYQINTPVATIGVRGTDYAIAIDSKTKQLYAEYYKGKPCLHNKNGEVCLSKDHKFAKVMIDKAPEILSEKPAIFDKDLNIVQAKIAPFGGSGSGSGGGRNMPRGVITNFCIQ